MPTALPQHAARPRRGWSAEGLALLASAGFTLACNGPFWHALLAGRGGSDASNWGYVVALGVALTALQFVLVAPWLNRWTVKPLLGMLVLATAFATWHMQRWGVYLDPDMLRNVLRTDVKEARELFSLAMLPHLLLYAGLPLALLWWLPLARRPLKRALWAKPLAWALALAVGVAALWTVLDQFAAQTRNQRELRYLVTPGNYLWSLGRVAYQETRGAARPRQVLGTDATRGPLAQRTGRKPSLLVLVVGETARAANWGLNGYARSTTPQLAALPDIISFAPVQACGTNTEVSLPCMFSPWGRRQYDEARIRGSQGLLHVLAHAGVQVLWRDNQSGCKGVCEGLPTEGPAQLAVPGLCEGPRCYDEVLLQGLADKLAASRGDQVVVLHQLGNHGPAYHLRYPPQFRRFTPTCDTADLRQCSREAITNAYDNALLYTDHVLARAIALLRDLQATHDTALLYVSDHGESLGERNLYLHGLPYAIAPAEQTQVPMLMWLSPGFAATWSLDSACLRRRAAQPSSHDHLFHTVLGLLDVRSAVHEPAMDLAGPCRRAP